MLRDEAFPSAYFKGTDVKESTLTLTITDVVKRKIQGDDRPKNVMSFKEEDAKGDEGKELVLNVTNWNTCEDAYGFDSNEWRGKSVVLYFEPNATYGGKRTGGIRIRIPGVAPLPAPSVDNLSYQQALELCAGAGISKDELHEKLAETGSKGYKVSRDSPTVRKMIADAVTNQDGEDDEVPF